MMMMMMMMVNDETDDDYYCGDGVVAACYVGVSSQANDPFIENMGSPSDSECCVPGYLCPDISRRELSPSSNNTISIDTNTTRNLRGPGF